jgi:DNA-binding MarR family transcriptional regulator
MSTPPLPEEVSAAPATKLANQLNSMAVHLLRRLRREDVALGVTAARLSALAVLVYGGPQTLRELAGREQVTAPTMTRIVDALVRDGLATRVAGEQDRRSVRIEATKRTR